VPVIQATFAVAAVVRPEPLRPAWNISDAEAESIAEPAARMLERANPRVTKVLRTIIDPIALCVASYIVYNNCRARENEIIKEHVARAAPGTPGGGAGASAERNSDSAPISDFSLKYYQEFTRE
jgi:hypothetical protein